MILVDVYILPRNLDTNMDKVDDIAMEPLMKKKEVIMK
jgi:hypothetical protein